jgi:endonuclease-3 related protein
MNFNIYIYKKLEKAYGHKHSWWPEEKTFYMPVSAILTQATSWKNVEKALNNLKLANVNSFRSLKEIKLKELEKLIKPAGFYRQKAKRLKALANYFLSAKEITREGLLKIKGIGKETADSIILYYFDKPYFVVDLYTKRLHSRLKNETLSYEKLALIYSKGLNVKQMKEFHALIVEHCKITCKKKPLCNNCVLKNICHYFKHGESGES